VAKKIRTTGKELESKGKAPVGKPARKVEVAAAAPVTVRKPPMKSPLSKAELDEFRKMLMDKRRALLGDMNGMEAETFRTNRQERSGDLSNIPIHPADVGTDNFEQEFTLGLLESERVLLREIEEALERIQLGTYGVCLGTGEPIDKARLRARPWAKYCIAYARLMEKGLVPREEPVPQAGEEGAEPEGEAEAEGEAETDAEPEPAEEEVFEEEPEE
jgi:RNA polymerase-binding protein DksA